MKRMISTPLTDEVVASLHAGDTVYLTGKVYSARDMAHQLLDQMIEQNKELPFDLRGSVIYYVGPTPAPPGKVIGSAGPTSSYRMDAFTPRLLKEGLKGMIGKGRRTEPVRKAISVNRAVYFSAVGGAAVLIAERIRSSRVIAFPELGTEAIREMTVENFPLIVANDMYGRDVFEEGKKKYKKSVRSTECIVKVKGER